MTPAIVALSLLLMVPWPAAACPPITRSAAVLRAFQRQHPCPSTGKTTGACPGWIKDHIIPLCLGLGAGGIDSTANLQWQTIAESRRKDKIERQMCHVSPGHCAHQGD